MSNPGVTISNVRVSKDMYAAHSEPSIAENPRNPKNLVAGSKMFTDPSRYQFKIGMYYSRDGGKTWKDIGWLPGFEAYDTVSDITVAFDARGTAYASVLAFNADESGVFVSISRDGGATWSLPRTVFTDTSGATFSDKPWIAVDRSTSQYRGTVYVAWNLDDNTAANGSPEGFDPGAAALRPRQTAEPAAQTGTVVARSTDGGQTWSAPVTIVPFTSKSRIFALGAIPQVDPSGRLRVAYLKWNDDNTNSMEMATSTDGGVTFSPPITIVSPVNGLPNLLKNGTFRNLSLPTFAVSSKDGSLAIAWSDLRNGDADILLARSSDGVTWSAPYRVNHDRLGNGKDQFQPALAVAPNGVWTAAWFDRRHDPANRLINEEIAQSTDGARTFGRNLAVTKRMWDPAIDAPKPSPTSKVTFIGDYQGLAVDNRTVHPMWNDTQNGTSQEVRTAVVSVQVFTRRP